ncbi:DUF2182 domain-containing protein [Chryseobacterium sp. BIGb0232]|uniref:copper chaperone n=1 Tax=Chryseobacterium sp. BIGb0232 TaxID=2940598 RepID=UPI000F48C044|nr:DUF2182 domain-containing protein [Chryseobacterium sp. BIGb0232]MCS4300980.1 putative metal-binding membrane protein [Chryseobacterium sp. BIGb0232]ROS20154.1 putative metal-binding integral membrane protein DUF2182 [Chryseobacterium nakagawai]
MKRSNANQNLISYSVWSFSIICWFILLFNPGNLLTAAHCQMNLCNGSSASLKMIIKINPFSEMMTGWILMVLAMMLPKLIIPIQIIINQSFKSMSFLLVILFITGYVLMWAVTGFLLNIFIIFVSIQMPGSFIPAVIFGIITLIWQFSPIKQKCLNRGHYHPVLAAWGSKAYKDAFSFGLTHGFWCVGAGWALMLLPMLLPQGHHLAMLIVTFIMLSEHMEHPQAPRWRIDLRLKLLRIIIPENPIRR